MERACRYVPMSKQPLVLVLAQVRFSRVARMADYADQVQEILRREGFPIDRSGVTRQVEIAPDRARDATIPRWEFRSRDERTSVILLQDSLVVQTTAYTRFEKFLNHLALAIRSVFSVTELDQHGVVERLGLRYVDRVIPAQDRSHESYLRPGLHGIAGSRFVEGSRRLHLQFMGRTDVGGLPGTLLVRIAQDDQGLPLPPDLLGTAPEPQPTPDPGKLVTLIDMDHFVGGRFDPDVEWILEKSHRLHDDLVETFHEDVITPEAVEEWK